MKEDRKWFWLAMAVIALGISAAWVAYIITPTPCRSRIFDLDSWGPIECTPGATLTIEGKRGICSCPPKQ